MRFCSILAAVCFAVRPIAAHPFPQAAGATIQRAAYFLDNNPSGCSIISLKIAQDGTLSNPVKAPTGGSGALAKWVISDPPPPDNTGLSGPDGLFSADAVVVSGQFLFSVNAGSNTLSMFTIDPTNAQKLTLVGKPANTLGEFPVSVAYSAKLNTACVLNGGAKSGVACFSVDKTKGLTLLDKSLRSLAPAINQSTPPGGPPLTVSDIKFNPSSTALFVSVKGAPPASPSSSPVPGFIFAWPVVNAKVSTTAVSSQPSQVILDFSLTFLGSDSSLLVTDAAGEAYILSVSSTFHVAMKEQVVLPSNEGLACWGVYMPSLSEAFVMSATNSNITVVNPSDGDVEGFIPLAAGDVGAFDSAVDRTFVYSLTNVAKIAVLNAATKPARQIQNLDLSAVGNRKTWQGMAVYSGA